MCNSCPTIKKNQQADLSALEALLSSVESDVRKIFIQYIARVKSPQIVNQIKDFLEAGRIDQVVNLLDSQFVGFEKLVADKVSESAEFEIGIFLATLAGLYAFSYKPTQYAAILLNQDLAQSLAAQILNTQRQILQRVVFDSFGLTSNQIAQNITNSIGLTERQYEAVKNYERLLRNQSSDALRRTLRDMKFDERLKTKRPLTEKQIERMVEAYRQNMLISRAQTIAQTEAGKIVNEGRRLGILQVLGFMQMPEGNVVKTWRSMNDDRVRFTHSHMGLDGQTVIGMETPFQSPSGALIRYPHDPQAPMAETINCRCYVMYGYIQ